MTTQTITATKSGETSSYQLNYRTCRAVVRTSNSVSRVSLCVALNELRELPEQGWSCK